MTFKGFFSIKDICEAVNLSSPTIGQMAKALREQCQAYLVNNIPEIGGDGVHVMFKEIRV